MTRPITILLVDDHDVVRRGFRAYFEALGEFEVVAEAENGDEAVRLAEMHIPDIVLMDLVMPGMNGVDATRGVKDVSPRTQIVVLTSYHDDEHIFPALQAGAISYVLKDVRMEEVAEAVRRAAVGEATLLPSVAARVIDELRSERRDATSPHARLTNREMDVLRLIAKGMSNAEIAENLVITQQTAKGHASNILSKLQLADRTQAAVYAWREAVVGRD